MAETSLLFAKLDFLYADNPKPDDVIAEDFFSAPEQWKQHRPALSQALLQAQGDG
jgi:hypothetical protein